MMQTFFATLGVFLGLAAVIGMLTAVGCLGLLITKLMDHFKYGRMFK
jgi:hypothetical protein